MKEIIKNNIINYELIRIRQNTPVLEYLKKHNFSFRLKQVSPELLEQLKNSDHLIDMKYGNFIAGYGRLKSESFRSSGGLKISDSKENILGSFIIEEKRIDLFGKLNYKFWLYKQQIILNLFSYLFIWFL